MFFFSFPMIQSDISVIIFIGSLLIFTYSTNYFYLQKSKFLQSFMLKLMSFLHFKDESDNLSPTEYQDVLPMLPPGPKKSGKLFKETLPLSGLTITISLLFFSPFILIEALF